jgi:hypothetical protein
MSFLGGIIGNASRMDPAAAAQEYGRLLGNGEQVHAAYLLVRDAFLFTDRRLILISKALPARRLSTTPYDIKASHISAWGRLAPSTSTPS